MIAMITMWVITGVVAGYVVSSGVGVVFTGASSLPLVDKIWWLPIPMIIFLVLYRLFFSEEAK